MIPPGCVNGRAVSVQSRCCPGPAANRHRGWPSWDASPATPKFTERKRSLPPTGTSVAGSPHGRQGATTGAGQACSQAVKRGELNSVSVQPPGSLGAAMAGSYPAAPPRPQPSGSPAAAACCRHDATTVNSRSANRLPVSLSEPKLPLRHSTAGRKARSDTLLVGSTPSTRAKVQRADHH
jgi:hypothetical protein